MGRLAVIASLALALAAPPASAASLPDASPLPPGGGAARLADRDGNGISDGLQDAIGAARPGDLFRVVVTSRVPGSAAAARQAVGPFALHREFRLIHGFAATMTAAQIRALSRQAGVFRIEEDAEVRTQMDAARPDFGVDAVQASFGLTGAGIRGCIVDTGVDPNHDQLNRAGIPFFDAITGIAGGTAYDDQGHGTHVASTAFGDGTGSTGAERYRGVAPGVTILAAKVLDASGGGTESQVIAGIQWCVEQGAHIISMSLGTTAPSDGNDALSLAANAAVTDHGRIVVVAAGNSGDQPGTIGAPGAAAQAITVGACADRSAPATAPNHSEGVYLTPFSSRGPTLGGATKPDVCAPGHSITAAKAGTSNLYATYSGTSMATPFVAGTIALALQARPMTPSQVKQLLESTAQDRGPAGKDNDWGAGLLDAYAFVAAAAGVTGYTPTAFPAYRRVAGTVGNYGLWSNTFTLGPADLATPIGATITIDGQVKCSMFLFGICFSAQWDPDLEARLVDPNGVVLAESTCLAGNECGAMGRQETVHAMPTVAGTYTVQVYPAGDSGNQGQGGSFHLDLSTGPIGSGSSAGGDPQVHVGGLAASSTGNKTGWNAKVMVTLHTLQAAGDLAFTSGATVSGTWSGGYSGNSSCVALSGQSQCEVTSGTIPKRKASATFTVTNVTGTLTYDAPRNHPNPATVTVAKPQ